MAKNASEHGATFSRVNTVAILAVILGPAVGALGLLFGWLQSQGERTQNLSLAQSQREHERQLRRGDRLFDRRASVYIRLFRLIDLRLVQVERTNPIITFGEAQEVPKNPPEEELNELQAEVGVFGSAEAWQLVLDFSEVCRKFFNASAMLDLTRRQHGATAEQWKQLDEHRADVRAIHTKIRERVQAEIETL